MCPPAKKKKTRAGPWDGNLPCPEKVTRDGPAHRAAIRRRWRRAGEGRGMKTLHFLPVPVLLESPCARSLLYVLIIIVSLVICADCCGAEFYKVSIDTASSWSMPLHCMPVTTFLRLCQLPSGKEAHSRRFS